MNMTQALSPLQTSLSELVRIKGDARSLQLKPRVIGARQGGQYVSRLRGRGMEFEESRPYQPGDDVRNIDWRVTARTGKAHSKVFREERERPVLISVDLRASMWFATRGRFKAVQAQLLAALLAWTAAQGGDRIGGEVCAELRHFELRPRRGRKSVLHLLKVMSDLRKPEGRSAYYSMQAMFKRMRHTAHPGSLVVFISDFRGFDAASETQLARIARHNDVLLLHVHDWLEAQLPEQGVFSLGDGQRVLSFDAGKRRLRDDYRQQYRRRVEHLQGLCQRLHMSWLECATDDDPVSVVRTVFDRRAGR